MHVVVCSILFYFLFYLFIYFFVFVFVVVVALGMIPFGPLWSFDHFYNIICCFYCYIAFDVSMLYFFILNFYIEIKFE